MSEWSDEEEDYMRFLGIPSNDLTRQFLNNSVIVAGTYRVQSYLGHRDFTQMKYVEAFMNPPRPTWTPRSDAAPEGRILDWSSITYPTAVNQPIPIFRGAGRFEGKLIWVGESTMTADYIRLGDYYDLAWNIYDFGGLGGVDPDAADHERKYGPLSESNVNYYIKEKLDELALPDPITYYTIFAVDRTYNGQFAVAFAEDRFATGVNLLNLWAGDTLLWSAATGGYTIDTGFEFTFYDGTGNDQDPTIAAEEGADVTPNFKRTVYVVFTQFDPMKFNGTIPTITAQLSEEPHTGDQTLAIDDLLGDLADALGYDPADIEFIGDFTEQCFGWTLMNDTDYRSAILAIADLYNIMVVDSGETLRFVRTVYGGGTTVDVTLEEDRLVERSAGNLVSSYRIMPTDIPVAFEISFPDFDKEYTTNVALAQRASGVYNTTPSKQRFNASSPVALNMTKAENLADRNLYMTGARDERHTFSVGPEHIVIEVGDVVEIPVGGSTRRCQVVQTTLNPDFTTDIEVEQFMADD